MKKLKELRTIHGLSLRDLAKELDISYSSLGKYERGEQEPGYDTLIRIADYFGVSVDYMIGHAECKDPLNQDLYNQLHLSEDAIEFLKEISVLNIDGTDLSLSDIFNHVITNPQFLSALKILGAFSSYTDKEWEEFSNRLKSSVPAAQDAFTVKFAKSAVKRQITLELERLLDELLGIL